MNQSQEFLRELQRLLLQYNANITVDNHWTGYAECGRDLRMTVNFSNGCEDFDLGDYVRWDSHGGRNG
ncbi:hypothetical protein M0R04_04815 [Candidatus Dojkabacteria bacterium]|jgi:hypothetical protein|nr:hypothetical protein [Candidatus Dojkabacteria bacterium]